MNFDFTEEQIGVRDMARDFAKTRVAPIADELDKQSRTATELFEEMGQLGLMGMCVPEEYGGAGLDMLSYVLAVEEVSRVCASTGVVISVNNSLACEPIERFGTEAQKKKYLSALASAQMIGCYCLTEPNAGTDAAAQATKAVKDGSVYRLSGTKQFITNGAEADLAIVYASTDPSQGSRGISAFIVETKSPGFQVAKKEKKLGIRGSSCVQITMSDVEVPAENLLHKEGEGYKVALSTLEVGRIGIAAQALGIGAAALEAAVKYSQEREQFGQPISQFQALQFMMADMATRLEAARLLTYKAARMKNEGLRTPVESSQAKLYSSEMCMYNAWAALQIHGGYGYIEEYIPERLFRDAKICEIYEGTSEVQRLLIARNLLKDQFQI